MLLRHRIRLANPPREVILIFRSAEGPRFAGKYIAGRDRDDPRQWIAAFDDSAAFHKDIAETYGIRPLGGGWCEVDHERRRIVLSGRSTQYGREPDRSMVLSLLLEAFPSYTAWSED